MSLVNILLPRQIIEPDINVLIVETLTVLLLLLKIIKVDHKIQCN